MNKYIAVIIVTLFFISGTAQAAAKGKILNVQQFNTPKGIEVWLVKDSTIPVISMSFSFDGGLDYDPEEKSGVGKMVSILLDEGAGEMDSKAFQQELNDYSIYMNFTAGRDAFVGGLKTLKQNRYRAYGLLKLALTSPRFDDDALVRMKNANIASINNNMGDPAWLVARTFNGMIFEGHKYSLPGEGNAHSIKKINRKDLIKFTKDQFATSVLKVAIAGDITAEEASEMVDMAFGELPQFSTVIDTPDAELKYLGKTILLPLDTPQSYVSIGAPGINIKDKTWQAATIMNYVLGGESFEARLMKEIREKRGLTYGIYSSLSPMNYANLIRVNFSTSNEKTQEALNVLRKEWQKMAKDGISPKELEAAKSFLTGSLLLDLTSTGAISSILNDLQQQGLEYNYINECSDAINAVTIEDVQNVAQKLLDKNNLMITVVGKPQGIKPDITLQKTPGMGE